MVERDEYSYVKGTAVLQPILTPEPEVKEPLKRTTKTTKKQSKVKTVNIKMQKRVIVGLLLSFALLMFITYRGNIINEKNLALAQMKKDIKTQNDAIVALKLDIEKTNDLNVIEQYAKEKLGMQKPQDNQIVYLDLGAQDHIAKTDDNTLTETNSVLKSVKEYIANIVKIVE